MPKQASIEFSHLQALAGDLDEAILLVTESYAIEEEDSDQLSTALVRLGHVRMGLRGAIESVPDGDGGQAA
jgi:hypothetical protein